MYTNSENFKFKIKNTIAFTLVSGRKKEIKEKGRKKFK